MFNQTTTRKKRATTMNDALVQIINTICQLFDYIGIHYDAVSNTLSLFSS